VTDWSPPDELLSRETCAMELGRPGTGRRRAPFTWGGTAADTRGEIDCDLALACEAAATPAEGRSAVLGRATCEAVEATGAMAAELVGCPGHQARYQIGDAGRSSKDSIGPLSVSEGALNLEPPARARQDDDAGNSPARCELSVFPELVRGGADGELDGDRERYAAGRTSWTTEAAIPPERSVRC